MRKHVLFVLSTIPLFLLSCSETTPSSTTIEPRSYSVIGFGETIDTLYYKYWSDQSWEAYNRTVMVGDKRYMTIVNSAGVEYFYDIMGYAGFKPVNEEIIYFQTTIGALPQELTFGEKYTRQTMFYYQGYTFTLKYENTLIDTGKLDMNFGTFYGCPHFSNTATVSSGGQSDVVVSESWSAKGPGAVMFKKQGSNNVFMMQGRVNGKGWGMSYPMQVSTESQPTQPMTIVEQLLAHVPKR